MLGVDTNILIRALLEDDVKEADIAKKLLKHLVENKKLFISSYTILEMAWVLKAKGYSRQDVSESILDLLDSSGVVVGQKDIVIAAIEKFTKGKADFGDYMILAEGQSLHAPDLATFDKELCKDTLHCKNSQSFLKEIF